MNPGAGSGRTAVVSPEPRPLARLQLDDVTAYMPFSNGDQDTTPTVAESGVYELRTSNYLGVWIARLKVAGLTTTTVLVKQNGSTIGTFSLTSGLTRLELDLSAVFGETGDDMTCETTAVGTDAKGLTVLAPIK